MENQKESLQIEFEKWLRVQKQPEFKSAHLYSESLKSSLSIFEDLDLHERDLFSIEEAEVFIALQERIRSSKYFDEANRQGNGRFSAALRQYERFLSERELGMKRFDSATENSDSRTSDATVLDTSGENVVKIIKSDFGDSIKDNASMDFKGKNVIYYGVPGSGKSYTIKREIIRELGFDTSDSGEDALNKKYRELWKTKNISRVVFHPDYTYSDFIGQILPEVQGDKVNYRFIPGPFTRILRLAMRRNNEPFFLIIEEINRGNAAAIFGDIFQLLDRRNHESEYPINNHEIGRIVYCISDDENIVADDENYNIPEISIPKNLWLIATMNTSDQNVFTLDTAFQRRWDMRLVQNSFNLKDHGFEIEGTGKTWKEFAEAVNDLLASADEMTSEDKRLGAWFIIPDCEDADGKMIVSKEHFANKVLKYLWEDAFKFNRDTFFNTGKYRTLEGVITKFASIKNGKGFGDLIKNTLSSNRWEYTEETIEGSDG